MSKLLNGVLSRVSEDNNEYRKKLRILNNSIDEKTTSLIGDVVTLSNYTIDFSNAILVSKEKLVNPIVRTVENYAIKDLRSVESVNEQFIDKINDKLDRAKIEKEEDKQKFVENLNTLLNDKYLEIVKIKRTNFLNDKGVNDEVEFAVDDFVSYLKTSGNYKEEKFSKLITSYKDEVYSLIGKVLSSISEIYLNSFIQNVTGALDGSLDEENEILDLEATNTFKPFIPDLSVTPTFDLPTEGFTLDTSMESDIPFIPPIPELPVDKIVIEDTKPLTIPTIRPIEVEEQKQEEKKVDKDLSYKKSYDVDEILKIAKSPVVTLNKEEIVKPKNEFVSTPKVSDEGLFESLEGDINEREIVMEMIRRLTKRLEEIDRRESNCKEEMLKIESDETFVNDLIESSNNKKEELDKFENELNIKEQELAQKKLELDKKLNDVLPFATAVMKTENIES